MISNLHGHDVAAKAALSQRLAEELEQFCRFGGHNALVYIHKRDKSVPAFPKPRPASKAPVIPVEANQCRRDKILDFIGRNPECSANKIYRFLKVNVTTLNNDLRYLQRIKKITYTKTGRAYLYSLSVPATESEEQA